MKVQHFAEVKVGLFTRIGFLFDMLAVIESLIDEDKSEYSFQYHAYVSYCKEKYKRPKFTRQKFIKLMNKVSISDMKAMASVIREAQKDIQLVKENMQSEIKKKSM